MARKSYLLFILIEIVFMLATQALEDIRGHNQPLGSHCDPIGEIDSINNFPFPTEFYERFVKRGKPFIIRGALDGEKFPAYSKWTDTYLNKTFGHLKVEVEAGKKDDRERGVTFIKLSEFLQTYNKSSIYLVTDMIDSWRDDVTLPVTLQCGGFQHLIDTTVMWFSSGGTKSQLHNDDTDNINCVLDGEKDVILIDKVHGKLVEANHWVANKAYSKVDVEKVDMTKFPSFKNIPWYSANVKKGDCIFIPVGWYHQINSHEGRNMAINFWFKHLYWFNQAECQVEQELKPRPLADFNVTSLEYRIKGADCNEKAKPIEPTVWERHRILVQGLLPLREKTLNCYKNLPYTNIGNSLTNTNFSERQKCFSLGGKNCIPVIVPISGVAPTRWNIRIYNTLFQFLDTNDDDKLTVDEIYKLNYDAMERYFPHIIERFKEEFHHEMIQREEKIQNNNMLDTENMENMMKSLLNAALAGKKNEEKGKENLTHKEEMKQRNEKIENNMLDTENMMKNLLTAVLGGKKNQEKGKENLINKLMEAALDTLGKQSIETELKKTMQKMSNLEHGGNKQQNNVHTEL